MQLDATTTSAGLLAWLRVLGATSGERLDGAPVAIAEGAVGDLPTTLVSPLGWSLARELGRRWTVDQLRELVDAPSSGGRP